MKFLAVGGIFAAVILCAQGCGVDCIKSADIQVTVVATAGVQLSSVTRLHVRMSVNDGPMRQLDITPQGALSGSETSFLLRPDPPPAQKYSVAITVEAFDSRSQLLAVGTGGGDAVANGCNRFDARLAPLGSSGTDGGVPTDGAPPPDLTMAPSPDLANCFGGMPDEDQDGRANSCDLCPADSDPTPTDSDGDGLPDACDPDVNRPGNRLLYFEPFDYSAPHWSGMYTVDPLPHGWLDINTGLQLLLVTNAVDPLPFNVRAQTFIYSPMFYTPNPPAAVGDVGLYFGSASGTNGVLCTLNKNTQTGDTLDINFFVNGQIQPPASQPIQFLNQVIYRLRLTQHGNLYTCESMVAGQPATTVTATAPNTFVVSSPQYLVLRGNNIEAHFNSVVAESVLP